MGEENKKLQEPVAEVYLPQKLGESQEGAQRIKHLTLVINSKVKPQGVLNFGIKRYLYIMSHAKLEIFSV